uniref:Uncharacterized protein n=1 Tax=viral metagenome TaxID=1070528 RepID=A0A6M3XQT3_9ZZZZ
MRAYLIVDAADPRPESGWSVGGRLFLNFEIEDATADLNACFTGEQRAAKTIIPVDLEVADEEHRANEGGRNGSRQPKPPHGGSVPGECRDCPDADE